MPSKKSDQPIQARAVILLSGGLDSATAAAWAQQVKGLELIALSIAYGQRHAVELQAARKLARQMRIEKHFIQRLDLTGFGGSALTDRRLKVPKHDSVVALEPGIPITYVPARNTVFLALALACAEASGAHDLVLGVNALDYSGYPDCRPAFIRAFQKLAGLATKAGVEGQPFRIHTPLIRKSKAQIVRMALDLGVDLSLTHSCYDPLRSGRRTLACGRCDSCLLRLKGFHEAGVEDPVPYR